MDREGQLDGAPLQHTGTCAAEHVLAGPSLQHNALDAVPVQDLRQQQPGWPAADDRDLGLHVVTLPLGPGFLPDGPSAGALISQPILRRILHVPL